MGTHPIFESDFDCLTDCRMENDSILAKCGVCNIEVDSSSHFDRHHPKCDTCHRRSCGGADIVSCRPSDKEEREKLIACAQCAYHCATWAELKCHYAVHQRVSLTCPHCPHFVAYQVQSLRRHQRQVHGQADVLKCSVGDCTYETKRKDNMTRHVRTKHGDMKKEFICEQCGVKCKSLTSLKQHKKSHSDGPFKCDYCTKEFKFINSLTSHMQTQHAQGVHSKSCDFCHKPFHSTDHAKVEARLKRHISGHKRVFQRQKYKCHSCIFGAATEAELHGHLCHRPVTEPTSVIAANPLFKTAPQGVPYSVIVQQTEPTPPMIPSELKTAEFDVFDEFHQANVDYTRLYQTSGVSVIRQSSVIVKKHESVIVSPPHSLFHYPSV